MQQSQCHAPCQCCCTYQNLWILMLNIKHFVVWISLTHMGPLNTDSYILLCLLLSLQCVNWSWHVSPYAGWNKKEPHSVISLLLKWAQNSFMLTLKTVLTSKASEHGPDMTSPVNSTLARFTHPTDCPQKDGRSVTGIVFWPGCGGACTWSMGMAFKLSKNLNSVS